MSRFRAFVKTTLVGGVAVLLPVALFAIVYVWVFRFLTRLIEPLSDRFLSFTPRTERIVADIAVILFLIGLCFLVGLLVRTRIGDFVLGLLDQRFLRRFPGYTLIKETSEQFFGGGGKKIAFRKVALVQPFGNETMMTGFITEEHPDGRYSVYVPAAPSPVAGNVYHLPERFVHPIDVPVERAMRVILGCGAGATALFDAWKDRVTPASSDEDRKTSDES